ncbi:MFS transporter, ACS family, hexuronate transporter [Chitinophaga costaii]|uniref:MFS transporter, ACS family, hexuronate transporter n=1 Tax=Chitinophaga costaii TaxID=1335309 RepID=A0A1C4FAW9_9BACT|nr:MFS transporter [Chitinophaga costaii]PUZ20727.1 MFS transporter [Chitinophaga costaii]SCC53010.1 MFS transporter, ACS family, hexuronate transporter [Chitinophaga costaii]
MKPGYYRWGVCALLFFATTINYLDRQVVALLKPMLSKEFNWTEITYSRIVLAFSITYAIGIFFAGKLVDTIGTRKGYALSVSVWSAAAMLHALVQNTIGFGVARALLGIGESGNFPTAIKTVAEWFPKKERALATGIFNSGSNIGAIVAPAVVPYLAVRYGWQSAFFWTGILGFIWLLGWWRFYQTPAAQSKLSAAEYAHIHSDTEPEIKGQQSPWLTLFRHRQTWAVIFGKLLTDPIWWFFLFWLPSYFSTIFNLPDNALGKPLIIIYSAAMVGSIGGGYLSSYLIRKGTRVFVARKLSLFIFACCVVPVVLVNNNHSLWQVVGIISLAAAAHQAWSANVYTLASDMFPKQAVSSVSGIGGMAGSVGGILFPIVVGLLLNHYKILGDIGAGYRILFIICASMYLLAWVLVHCCAPKMETVKFD